ncbi:YecA family protein [Salinimonas sp. HHU 13199]|uniref:YecA family protein n=1 Tax=Salinimonas profundi TaxID=2729140 RepID=A0ABR8LJ05_9ALTE|nr:UPF0149 family protein [Salinimonas profundi]MBD3586202.1 YecA family protein [Salinimonas profundi]
MTQSADAFEKLYSQPRLCSAIAPQAESRGLMIAVCAAPEIPLPEQWMPWFIRQDPDAPRLSQTQIDELAQRLMYCLRDTLNLMRLEAPLIPDALLHDEQPGSALQLWLTGLLRGHQHLEQTWQNAWKRAQDNPAQDSGLDNEDPARRLRRCLKFFSTLADIDTAMKIRDAAQQAQLQQSLHTLVKQLPSIVDEYIKLAGELAAFLPNQFEMYDGKLEK